MIWPLLRTRRWLGFTALVVVVIIAFGLLSAWQWSRAEDRRSEREALTTALAAPPLTLERSLLTIPGAWDWTPTTAQGVYDTDHEVLVRKRPLDARNGFWVMTPLLTDDVTVWVNRGWIPVGADALSTPEVPPPPTGRVEVTGYLVPFEESEPDRNEGLPDGQIAAPAIPLLPSVSASDVGVLRLATSTPEQADVRPLPLPEVDDSRNISYAVQWLIFAAIAISGWFFFLRREAREDAMTATTTGGPDGSGTR